MSVCPAVTREIAQADPGQLPGAVESDLSFRDRLYDLWLSPVNGLYGIREASAPRRSANPNPAPRRDRRPPSTGGEQVPAELVTAPGNTGPYNAGDHGRRGPSVLLRAWPSVHSSPSP